MVHRLRRVWISQWVLCVALATSSNSALARFSEDETGVSEQHEGSMHIDAAAHDIVAESSSFEETSIPAQTIVIPQSRQFILNPTLAPSFQPSVEPSQPPTLRPSYQPTLKPNAQPTLRPTSQPTLRPTPTPAPSPAPSPVGFEKIEQVGSSAQVLVWLLIIVAIAAGVYCYWQRKETLLKRAKRNFSDSDDIFFDDPDGLELRSPSSSHSAHSASDSAWDQRAHGSRSSSKNQWPASAVPRNVPLRFPVEGSGGPTSSASSSGVSPMHGGGGIASRTSSKKKGYAQVGGGAELESESSCDDEEGHEY